MPGSKIRQAAIRTLVGATRPLLRGAVAKSVTDTAICRLQKPGAQMAWQVALPKSGSTWVHRVLSGCLEQHGWKASKFFSVSGYREQLLDPRSFLLEDCLTQSTYGLQQHCLFSDYTHYIIEKFQIRVILQVRDIFDCLVSLADHYDKSTMMPLAPLKNEHWRAMDKPQRDLFLAQIVAPWYIRFWVGWEPIANDPDSRVRLIRYEQLLSDQVGLFTELAQYCDRRVTREQVQACLNNPISNTRKNKGVVGRGASLTQAARDHVRSLASYYPDTDFGPIGL